MRLWSVSVLAVLVLAGCADVAQDGDDDPLPSEPADEVKRFLSDGTEIVVDEVENVTSRFVNTDHTGAEPNIGITSSGAIFVTAFTNTLRSRDGGATWEVVHTFSMTGTGHGTSDPMLWVDTDTDRVYVNHMYQTTCFNMIWSDDEGDTWTQRDMSCIIPSVDHQKVLTSKPGPEPNPQTARLGTGPGQYPNVLYTCYNAQFGNQCFASFDGGITYTQEAITMGSVAGQGPGGDCSGVGGHPAAAPDGTIAVAAGWNCGPTVSHSRDSGLTWTAYAGPTEHGVGASIDPDLAFTPDGTMYLMYRDAEHMARVARSPDLGATWEGVWNITAPGLTSTRFHVMSSGDDGRIAMAYIGTDMPRGTAWTDDDGEEQVWEGRPHDAPPNATWHLYIVTSESADEDDPVFTSYKVTPDEDPVQKGCSWESGGGGGPRSCRNLLDFIDSAVAPNGTFYVTYTDGCTTRTDPVCAGDWENVDEMDARDRETAVAWLDGWSLKR